MPEKLQCPLFQKGCPYSSFVDSESQFGKYLASCKSFESGCPFKELVDTDNVKSILDFSGSKRPLDELLDLHKKMDVQSWTETPSCPAFKNGCVFAKSANHQETGCPLWKKGCPFKEVLSSGIPLNEALRSNCWDQFLVTSLEESSTHEGIPVARMLKDGTKESHELAENVQFVKKFRKKEITRELYQLLIRNLYFVYITMEKLFEEWSKKSENVKSLRYPQLDRTESLEQDLEFFYGKEWRTEIMKHSDDPFDLNNMSPATANYVKQLLKCSENQEIGGELLIAHAYTRYLGDLSGGQLLKRMARRSMNLPAAPRNATNAEIAELPASQVDGTRFYDFKDIEDVNAFKNMFRDSLNCINVTEDVAKQIVAESNVAFRLNMEVFQELDVIAGFTTPEDLLRQSSQPKQSKSAAAAAECPFSSMFSTSKDTTEEIAKVELVRPASHVAMVTKGSCPVHNPKIQIFAALLVLCLAFLLFKVLF